MKTRSRMRMLSFTSSVLAALAWIGVASAQAQVPTAEIAETPPSIKKSDPTTYAESSDAR